MRLIALSKSGFVLLWMLAVAACGGGGNSGNSAPPANTDSPSSNTFYDVSGILQGDSGFQSTPVNPQIVANDLGNAITVWEQSGEIWASHHVAG